MPKNPTYVFLALGLAVCGATRADDVAVGCPGGAPAIFTSISDALYTLDPVGPHTITVTGSCVENVVIAQRSNLHIAAPGGQSADITPPPTGEGPTVSILGSRNILLQRLVIFGGGQAVHITRGSVAEIQETRIENNWGEGILVDENSFASLGGSGGPAPSIVISGNGGHGLSVIGSEVSITGNGTIENNGGNGIRVDGGRLNLVGSPAGNAVLNNAVGVNLFNGAAAEFIGETTISNNGLVGVGVGTGASAVFRLSDDGAPAVTTIEGHDLVGITATRMASVLMIGPHLIGNNGTPGWPSSGIRIAEVSSLRTQSGGGGTTGPQITGNSGPGVLVEDNASITLHRSTISGNMDEGVLLARLSVARFLTLNTLDGNGAADLSCDQSSLVSGDLTGVTTVDCKLTGSMKK